MTEENRMDRLNGVETKVMELLMELQKPKDRLAVLGFVMYRLFGPNAWKMCADLAVVTRYAIDEFDGEFEKEEYEK